MGITTKGVNMITTVRLSILVMLITINVKAQEIEFQSQSDPSAYSIGFENTMSSKYVWNGMSINEGFVVQPELWFSIGQFTFDVWSSYTMREKNDDIKRHEVDLGLYYESNFGDLTLTSGFLYYLYPDQDDSPSTGELVLNVSYPITENLNLETELSADVIEHRGILYGYHGLSYSADLSENFSFESSLGMGWANKKFNTDYVGYEKQAINYLLIGAGVKTDLLSPIALKPFIEYYSIPNSELSEILGNNNFNLGINLSIEL